jgi:ParB/RepB/Spo0J family partition protein
MKIAEIPLASITLSGTNPRRTFDEAALAELTESVRAHGILQPVLVRPVQDGFELIAGHRRLRAAEAAGLDRIPALVRDLDDRQSLEAQVVENLQREDLHPLEEADGYRRLVADHGYTVAELATKVSRSQSYIYGRIRLAEIPERAKELYRLGRLTLSTAQLVSRVHDATAAVEFAEVIAEGERRWTEHNDEVWVPLDYQDALAHLQRKVLLRLDQASWDLDDAGLVQEAGACTACPKRTGNQPMLFGADALDSCTDRSCWWQKATAAYDRKLASTAARPATREELKKVTLGGDYSPWRARDAGLVELDEVCPGAPRKKSLRKLLGKDSPGAVLVQDPQTGRTIELVERAAAEQVLAQKYEWARTTAKAQKATLDPVAAKLRKDASIAGEAKRRAWARVAEWAELTLLFHSPETPDCLAGWRLVAAGLVDAIWTDTAKAVAARRGLKPPKGVTPAAELKREIRELPADQAVGVVVELIVARSFGEEVGQLLEMAGCDLKAIEKEVRAEQAAAEKAKAKKTPRPKASARTEGGAT